MDKVISSFNTYDIFGRFIPGAALIIFADIFANDGLKNWISGYMNIGDGVSGWSVARMIITAYFLGTIINMIGICFSRIREKKLYTDIRRISESNTKVYPYPFERKVMYEFQEDICKASKVQKLNDEKEPQHFAYSLCYSFLESKNQLGRIKDYAVMHEMSISLSVVSMFVVVVEILNIVIMPVCGDVIRYIVMLIFLISAVALFNKGMEYQKMRIRNVFRMSYLLREELFKYLDYKYGKCNHG